MYDTSRPDLPAGTVFERPRNDLITERFTGHIGLPTEVYPDLPDIVCPAHTDEYSPDKQDLEQFLGWAYRLRDVMTDLILQPDPNFGMDYRWCQFYPFRQIAARGEEFQVELIVRNHLFRPGRIQVRLKYPDDVSCRSGTRTFTMEPKSQVAVPFRLRRTGGPGRRVVTADITFNGRRLGEVTELLID